MQSNLFNPNAIRLQEQKSAGKASRTILWQAYPSGNNDGWRRFVFRQSCSRYAARLQESLAHSRCRSSFSCQGLEKGPAAGLGVSVMAQEHPLGVPGCVSSTNHEVFQKAYLVSQGILRSIVTRHNMLSVAGEPVRDPLRSLPAHPIFFNYLSIIYLSLTKSFPESLLRSRPLGGPLRGGLLIGTFAEVHLCSVGQLLLDL